ncbi:MAG TPA: PTS sugar transporter subunit IIA, partial [Myxococcota bacterium]|nr:PTS sugar transporter subunit IIA [Myxococcota bacterium]
MRVGVVVVSHYRVGEEMLQAVRLIVPSAPDFRAVAIGPKQTVEEIRTAIARELDAVDEGAGALILTDMFGGTPSNVALSFLGERAVEVVTGVNLPMLIKLASWGEGKSLAEV